MKQRLFKRFFHLKIFKETEVQINYDLFNNGLYSRKNYIQVTEACEVAKNAFRKHACSERTLPVLRHLRDNCRGPLNIRFQRYNTQKITSSAFMYER